MATDSYRSCAKPCNGRKRIVETVQWGIIGCGDVTEMKSGPALQKIDHSELVAVMRRDGNRARDYAKRHGVPHAYSDAEKLINHPDVNAIYIATPPDTHAEYTVRAARAGKPVYVEKPMARTHAECLRMIEACRKEQVSLFVAYYRRALPYFLQVKALLDDNAIGTVHAVRICLYQQPMAVDQANPPWRVVRSISGGGLFFDLASHQLDLLEFLFGPIEKAYGTAASRLSSYDAEDTVSASFQFSSGTIGSGSWCFCASERHDRIELIGEKGQIDFSTFSFAPITLHNRTQQHFDIAPPPHVQQPLIKTVVSALRNEGRCPSTGQSAARTNYVMEQIVYGR